MPTLNADSCNVTFGWKLPDGRWVRAQFEAEVVAYDEPRDRWVCILRRLVTDISPVPLPIANPIRELIGKWVQIPTEGRNGQVLPLKLDTLRGKPRYFYEHDPRIKPAVY
jgi:hypothetical protein